MIATLVIGLREGLEATLIVGIIAAFLRRNRVPLWPMWIGVGASVALSIAVGVGLQLVAQALPQQQQEGMEAIIGTVAVVFVTVMILWMRKHSRSLRDEFETVAARALGRGTAWALAGMAFLAILKEGFETSVFLLAAFQASSNTALAATGAAVGVAAAVVIGFGIYTGGVRLDLGRFFVGTGVFLVFVAAGLVVTVLRRAHEAGWLNIGQQRTIDLTWLVPAGTIRYAVLNGLLGVLADPRVIEVLGWLLYVVPVLAIALWPRALRPRAEVVPRIRWIAAASLAVVAAGLAIDVPTAHASVPATAAVRGSAGSGSVALTGLGASGAAATVRLSGAGSEHLAFAPRTGQAATHDGAAVTRWRTVTASPSTSLPATLSIDDLVTRFGRVPVGISATQEPGPFTAHWAVTTTRTLWTAEGGVVDASRSDHTVLTLTGGGLTTSRTYALDAATWSVPTAGSAAAAASVSAAAARNGELVLWRGWLPLALAVAAATQAALAVRAARSLRSSRPTCTRPPRSLDHVTA